MVFYTYVDIAGLGTQLFPASPVLWRSAGHIMCRNRAGGIHFYDSWCICITSALLDASGAEAYNAHSVHAFGALGLAQTGVILILAWFAVYPLIAWMHYWVIGGVGIGDYLTVCARKAFVPGSCAFSQEGGYISRCDHYHKLLCNADGSDLGLEIAS